MITFKSFCAGAFTALALPLIAAGQAVAAEPTEVAFDIPDKIECRDVTPEKCAAAHPNLKVIEAKFRISANFIRGSEDHTVDFDYLISSPGMRLKILDYLPNTTLESTYADDQIEVADLTENTDTTGTEAKVAYSVLSLGGTKNQTAKKSEQNHYKRVAPKSLVLASGTTNRGHGVFYKLRPSNGASLEGAKEFTFLAIVPKTWRADWCTFVCAARANKKSFVTSSIVLAGIEQAHVGLYLSGDHEASDLCGRLCQLQEANDGVLAKEMAKEAAHMAETMHVVNISNHSFSHHEGLLHTFIHLGSADAKAADKQLEQAKAAIMDVQDQLAILSAAAP
jgi:hypothetical protein